MPAVVTYRAWCVWGSVQGLPGTQANYQVLNGHDRQKVLPQVHRLSQWPIAASGGCCGPASGLLAGPPPQSEETSSAPFLAPSTHFCQAPGPSSEDPLLKLVPVSLRTGMFLAVWKKEVTAPWFCEVSCMVHALWPLTTEVDSK